MKNVLLIGAAGLAAILFYKYFETQKKLQSKAEPATQTKEIAVNSIEQISAVKPGGQVAEMLGEGSAVEAYNASPRATFSTPVRLLVNSRWPEAVALQSTVKS